jgi:hypothetical protein
VHSANATLGPYGPYRDWPPKTDGDDVEAAVPNAPARDAADTEKDMKGLVTGKTLDPLQHEGQAPNSSTDRPHRCRYLEILRKCFNVIFFML